MEKTLFFNINKKTTVLISMPVQIKIHSTFLIIIKTLKSNKPKINLLLIFLLILLSVAFLTLFERKILGIVQNRKGPSKVGIHGIFQPFADAIKLFSKNTRATIISIKILYFFIPLLFIILSLMFIALKFFITGLIYTYNVFFILLFYSLRVYLSLISG